MTELYQRHSANIPTRDLMDSEKRTILLQISNLQHNQLEDLFFLIYEDFLELSADPDGDMEMPYGCSQLKKGIKFDLQQLPVRLRHIIRRYLIDIFGAGVEEESDYL